MPALAACLSRRHTQECEHAGKDTHNRGLLFTLGNLTVSCRVGHTGMSARRKYMHKRSLPVTKKRDLPRRPHRNVSAQKRHVTTGVCWSHRNKQDRYYVGLPHGKTSAQRSCETLVQNHVEIELQMGLRMCGCHPCHTTTEGSQQQLVLTTCAQPTIQQQKHMQFL